jgi:rod shape determining protein RodA
MRKEDSLTRNIDWSVLGVMLLMVFLGLLNMYSAAAEVGHPSLFDLKTQHGMQFIWICIAFFLGLVVFLIDSDIYYKYAIPIFLGCLGLLILVLFMPAKNGARSWLGFGGFGIQPAEFAKVGTAILLARYVGDFNKNQQNINTTLISLGILLIPMGMIMLQPDAGTFVVFTSFLFVLYREGITFDPLVLKITNIIPGIKYKQTWIGSHFIPIIFVLVFLAITTLFISNNVITFDFLPGYSISGIWGVIVAFSVIFIIAILFASRAVARRQRGGVISALVISYLIGLTLIIGINRVFVKLKPHQKIRIELFLGLKKDDDGEDYNRNRAMAAVGSGGLLGKGFKEASVSSVAANHVPESDTDFIFCPLSEEWGFVGSFLILGLFVFLQVKCVFIAERQRTPFNRIYAYCVAMILFYHVAINIGMNIGFAPVIGIPLPFFSYGGSSMMSFSIMMFILLKLDSQRKDML